MSLRIVEKLSNGLPRIVEVRSRYPFKSANGRDWPVEGLKQACDFTSRVLHQGAKLANYKSHPKDDYVFVVLLNGEEPIREYHPSSNEIISWIRSIWIDEQTQDLVSRSEIDYSTEAGKEWGALIKQAEEKGGELPISINVEAYCTLPQGQGHCYPYASSLLFWDWLIPGLEEPGIEGSGFTKIVEINKKYTNKSIENITSDTSQKPCCNNCEKGKPCSSGKHENVQRVNQIDQSNQLSLLNKSTITEAREDKSSGGLKTKGAKKMDFDQLIKDLLAQGAPWSAAKAILQGQGADDAVLSKAAMAFMEGGLGDPELGDEPPAEEMKDKNPSEYEKKKKAFEFKKNFNLARGSKTEAAKIVKTETVKPIVLNTTGVAGDAASLGQLLKSNPTMLSEAAAVAMGLTPSEAKEMGERFKAEKQATTIREALEQQITACRNTKTLFEGHDVSNLELYPVAKVQTSIEDIAKLNKNLDVARERLSVRLERLAFNTANEIAKKVEEDKKIKESANKIISNTYQPGTASIPQRYREQQEKVVKMLVDIAQKYAPGLYTEYQRSKKEHSAHLQEHNEVIHWASERTYKNQLTESANWIADRKLESTTTATNSSNLLNFPVFMDGAMEFIYWASPVMRLVSALPVQSVNVGQPVRIGSSSKFAQFVQVNSRERTQRRRHDPRRKITSNKKMRQTQVYETSEQFYAVRDTSSIKIDRAIIDYLKNAPLFENVPELLLMHLVAEILFFRQLKVSMELVMSAHRYKLLTIEDEITQNVSGERVTSSTPGVTLGGITFPNAKTAVWMRRGEASGGTVTYGPVMQPSNKPAVNVYGVVSEATEYPIVVTAGGLELTPAMLDHNQNITEINDGDDLTNAFAFHPKGILVTTQNYAAEIAAGTFIIEQYSKVRNYHPMAVALPGSTARKDWGNQKVEELGIVRSDVKTKRHAEKPDYVLIPEGVWDKSFAFASHLQNTNQIDGLDYAKISTEYGKDVQFAAGNYRGAEILTTDEPYLGEENLLGILGKKGKTVCQELSMPQIDGPWPEYETDEDGHTGITDEDTYRLSETTFIQTIAPRDSDPNSVDFGEYKEYSQTSLFFTDTPESSSIIA